MSNINEVPNTCSNCGYDIDFGGYECPSCGTMLCDSCTCLCGIEAESKLVEKAFEIQEDDLITKLGESIQEVRKKKAATVLNDGEDQWIEIRNIPIIKEDEENDI